MYSSSTILYRVPLPYSHQLSFLSLKVLLSWSCKARKALQKEDRNLAIYAKVMDFYQDRVSSGHDQVLIWLTGSQIHRLKKDITLFGLTGYSTFGQIQYSKALYFRSILSCIRLCHGQS